MIVLDNLPGDVILEILSCLSDDRQALWSLTVTNCRFYELTLPLLYRRVDLYVRPRLNISLWFESYLHTIRKRPDLVMLAKELNLTWYKDSLSPSTISRALDRINALLRMLPNVRYFGLRLFGVPSNLFVAKYLDATFMSSLLELKIKEDAIGILDFLAWTGLKKIESLHIKDVKPVEQSGLSSAPSARCAVQISLTHLSLGSNIFLLPSRLRRILRLTPLLTELACNVPIIEIRDRKRAAPGSVAQVLEPVRSP